MLKNSQAVVTIWHSEQLVAFGRATSDSQYRAVLWDIVVDVNFKGIGLGRQVVDALLTDPSIASVERIYLMTTQSQGFYHKLGFNTISQQTLMIKETSG